MEWVSASHLCFQAVQVAELTLQLLLQHCMLLAHSLKALPAHNQADRGHEPSETSTAALEHAWLKPGYLFSEADQP